ncbi:MAG: type II toxin-antitoxin system VapC family toxin [Actinomycetia bacterium]|nr:type II toxin-antitoxin system VapC family toxin [Actinomycetes bacterium]
MIVLDASVLANFVGDDGPDGHHVRSLVATAGDAAIPDLADIETAAVLRKRWIDKTIPARRFATALSDLADSPFRRYPAAPLLSRVYELRANVTAYDAIYVALTEALGWELLTADARLTRASGPRCPIQLVETPTIP